MATSSEAVEAETGTAGDVGSERAARLVENIESVIEGKHGIIRLAVATLLARGHLLFEDVPGTGKTTLAKALARSIQCRFGRVQATSDLLPSDVLGITVLDPKTGDFAFHRGPVFTNLLLVDEINRATPRTQSALLEAMAEGQITVDRETYPLETPFMVLATQNPAEQVGTYFLPESQMDRFAVRLSVGYPDFEAEQQVLTRRDHGQDPLERLEPVCAAEEILTMQGGVKEVRLSKEVQEYLLRLVTATRERKGVLTGVSTRGALVYQSMAQAVAFMDGRDYVTPDDVKDLAVPVLAHRLLLASRLRSSRHEQEEVVEALLGEVPCP